MRDLEDATLSALREENVKLKQALLGLKRRLEGGHQADIEEELALLRTRLGLAEERSDKQKSRIAGLVERLRERDEQLATAEGERGQFDEKLQQTEETRCKLENDLRKAREALQVEIERSKELTESGVKGKREVQATEEKLLKSELLAKQKLQEAKRGLEAAESKLEEQVRASKGLEEKNHMLSMRLSELSAAKDKQREHYTLEITRLQQTLEQYTKESKTVEERYLAAVKEKVAAQDELDHVAKELKSAKLSLLAKERALEEQCAKLEQLEPLKRELVTTKETVKGLQSERVALQDRLHEAQNRLKHTRELQAQLEELGEQHAALSGSLESANKAYQEAMEQSLELKETGRHQARRVEELQNQLRNSHATEARLGEQLVSSAARIKERESQLESSQRHLARSLKEITMLRAALEKRKLELLQAQGMCSDARAELKELQLKYELAEEKVRAAETQSKRSEEQAEGLRLRMKEMESALQEAKGKVSKLERSADSLARIEREYQQLKSVFTNIRSSLGALSIADEPSPFKEHLQETQSEEPGLTAGEDLFQEHASRPQREGSDLFDNS